MKLERKVTMDQGARLFVSSIGVLDVGQTYAVSCATNIAVFRVWSEDAYMECAYTHKGNRIPHRFLTRMGLHFGNKVRIMKDDACVFVFRSDFDGNLSELNSHMPYCAAIDEAPVVPQAISMRSAKAPNITLPFSDSQVVVTSRVIGNRYWLELRPYSEKYKDLLPETQVGSNRMLDGFSYRICPRDLKWTIPKDFDPNIRLVKSVPCGMVGDVFVIEASLRTCDICGNSIRSSSDFTTGWTCPTCAKHLGKGGVLDALTKTAKIIR